MNEYILQWFFCYIFFILRWYIPLSYLKNIKQKYQHTEEKKKGGGVILHKKKNVIKKIEMFFPLVQYCGGVHVCLYCKYDNSNHSRQ